MIPLCVSATKLLQKLQIDLVAIALMSSLHQGLMMMGGAWD
jgi:hypothetical protein